jgi:transcriptional regulator with PAS, ATPase and Fis domain
MHIETRVISATNKDINKMIEDGLFRKDLYFRLGVIKVQVPSLSERPDDIVPLAKYFLQEFSKKFGKKFTEISSEAKNALLAHDWTGNVRELKNLMEGAALTGKGPHLKLKGLGLEPQNQRHKSSPVKNEGGLTLLPPEGLDLSERLQSFERHYIEQAFKIAKGNESKAAKLLNMNHHTFRYRRKKLFAE